MKKSLLILSVLALAACSTAAPENPVLTIDGGQVQGVTADIPGVYVYRGIPYAAPPLGELRWKAPQPVVPWEGVLVADSFGHPSYQAVHYPGGYATEWGYGDEAPYSEDCLYLNVWTKAPGQVDKKLPVALWIHGGGYREGWGSEPEFDGQEWADKDVVLVSINYRLGVFGFLTHPELSAENPNGVSGNYGILDQIEALNWIQNNIEQFGGDPDNVTIFGQSAGGGSVKTLCESPLARGKFHKAVIMSAGGINTVQAPAMPSRSSRPEMTLAASEKVSKKVLDWAGFTDLEKMRAASTEMLYTVNNMYNAVNGTREYMTASPIVDGYVCKQSFDDAAVSGNLADVPYMIGYTLNDMGNMSPGIAAFALDREKKGAKCLITGESLGQVASQTMEGITSSNAVVTLPVLRPLIGFDKEEIIVRAKKIGTFDTSVLPYEDCCTVFLPEFPAIKPKLSFIEEEEGKLDVEGLVEEALASCERISIH